MKGRIFEMIEVKNWFGFLSTLYKKKVDEVWIIEQMIITWKETKRNTKLLKNNQKSCKYKFPKWRR